MPRVTDTLVAFVADMGTTLQERALAQDLRDCRARVSGLLAEVEAWRAVDASIWDEGDLGKSTVEALDFARRVRARIKP